MSTGINNVINDILAEDIHRQAKRNIKFDPITGEGSVGERVLLKLSDYVIKEQWIPISMLSIPFINKLRERGSFESMIAELTTQSEVKEENIKTVQEAFIRLRILHDFAFWAACYIYILSKKPGEGEILFHLSRPQRHIVELLEQKRLSNKPIRYILLKARQWGGSTVIQLYMVWLQVVHKVGLNSVIVSQTKKTSFTIKSMLDRALSHYPTSLLHKIGQAYKQGEKKIENVGMSSDYKRIISRDCTITVASYEAPDALRGDAYSLVHCSEVALWSPTEKKTPESVIRSACSGVALMPYTMIIFESTANGTGNFFHREYLAAKAGNSLFDAVFVPWYDIDIYTTPFESEAQKYEFAKELYENKDIDYADSTRKEPGKYLWDLWQEGATLEAIHWYIQERKGKNDHGIMASEYPSDDIEAFVHSGDRVFDIYQINRLRNGCRSPRYKGELQGDARVGKHAMRHIHFIEEQAGHLSIWEHPENDTPTEKITNRYLCVMDVGGRSEKADYTVIAVFDRIWMNDGGMPTIVAQWRGHGDHDITAWKAVQIAAYYNNALLVIESNTLETTDKERYVDGDQSHFILNQIRECYNNLYARRQSEEDIRQGAPKKYGFHTNTATKPMVIDTLIMAIRDKLYIERCTEALDEYAVYERKQNGAYGAVAGFHDDILMTRAIGLHICFNEMPMPRIINSLSKEQNRKRNITRKAKAMNEAQII